MQMTQRGPSKARFEIVRLRCSATLVYSAYPSRLLVVPMAAKGCATLYWIQYGGGMVSGDEYRLELELLREAVVVLATQGANKVYKSARSQRDAEFATCASLLCVLGLHALLVSAPEPTILYRDASFKQDTVIRMGRTASLFYVDWVASGRTTGQGESWNFSRFYSTVQIALCDETLESAGSGTVVVNERVLLSEDDNFGKLKTRMGRFESHATIYILGPALADVANTISRYVCDSHRQLLPGTLVSASESVRYARLGIPTSANLVVRIAATSTELVQAVISTCCASLVHVLGYHPYERRGN
ncbi:Urease accessory protein D [Porphyridium purpureum]|uniref:Urease accessory protein D n=1 Tax=Porphyridium purpureum TaxID=35688 RepID=A0A5J4Z415_PORPP|nr:Urease accessory protein D [Porphyridium purpureum]|eukprot:POR4676..scf295_1